MWNFSLPDAKRADAAGDALVELRIESLGARGDGIAHDGAGLLYVPYTVPGDQVKATIAGRRGDGRLARLDRVLHPGPDRAAPASSLRLGLLIEPEPHPPRRETMGAGAAGGLRARQV